MRPLIISIYALSVLVAIAFAVMALVLVSAVAGQHLALLRAAGALLFAVVAAHLLPLRFLVKRLKIVLYLVLAIAAAWGFGVLYYFAEIDDPFRSEGEMGSNIPFRLAFYLSILPGVRAAIRLVTIKISAQAPAVNNRSNLSPK